MTVQYTDPAKVTGIKTTDVPVSGQTVSGYGGQIPTATMVEYDGTWRRVYAMVYSNSGTPYVKVKGANLVLDLDTRHRIDGGEGDR
jgi:hypothetical protein